MDRIVVEDDKVRALLQDIVDAKGQGYRYQPFEVWDDDTDTKGLLCKYFDKGAPSCLVGHLLDRVGVEPQDRFENTAAEVVVPAVLEVSHSVVTALSQMQHAQDTGQTWGEALAEFDKTYAKRRHVTHRPQP